MSRLIDLKRIKRFWSYNPLKREVSMVIFDTEFSRPVTSISKYAPEETHCKRMIAAISTVSESFKIQ